MGKVLTKNIRERINDLSETRYSQIEELNTPDVIFMFLGIDDSLSVALKHDPELVSYADKKRIALVSPSILHISIKQWLKTLAFRWSKRKCDQSVRRGTKISCQAAWIHRSYG